MEIYNTNEIRGDRFVYVRPGEDQIPEISMFCFKAKTPEILYALIRADKIKFIDFDRGEETYLAGINEDHPEYGAVVLKYETDEEGNFIMRDIGHMEDFATAVMVLNEILLPRMK